MRMYLRDRVATLILLATAIGAWLAVAFILTTLSPKGDGGVQAIGAAVLGIAATTTITPLLWLVGFARQHRIAYRGDWARAARRGSWVGIVITVFVLLRAQGAFSLPIGLFVVAMVVFVELTLTARR